MHALSIPFSTFVALAMVASAAPLSRDVALTARAVKGAHIPYSYSGATTRRSDPDCPLDLSQLLGEDGQAQGTTLFDLLSRLGCKVLGAPALDVDGLAGSRIDKEDKVAKVAVPVEKVAERTSTHELSSQVNSAGGELKMAGGKLESEGEKDKSLGRKMDIAQGNGGDDQAHGSVEHVHEHEHIHQHGRSGDLDGGDNGMNVHKHVHEHMHEH